MSTSEAHELATAFKRSGFTKANVKQLFKGDLLKQILDVVRGRATIVSSFDIDKTTVAAGQIIDCSESPPIPKNMIIHWEDQVGSAFRGQLVWKPGCISLLKVKAHRGGGRSSLEEPHLAVVGQPVLPANILDWQMEDPTNRIPESWKTETVFYWGTIYRHWHGSIFVRYLRYNGTEWQHGFFPLDDNKRPDGFGCHSGAT